MSRYALCNVMGPIKAFGFNSLAYQSLHQSSFICMDWKILGVGIDRGLMLAPLDTNLQPSPHIEN